ncbi:hypothetical protein [Actinacidiphila acididurans]|uniref:Uncharacterized protein n=1 Tax=Actinacidiphila acididurans TaxID=2784346 RepID=A0ABS2U4Q4_9ACTN|nr:hypothetical protein [Actinacidiphila acididurans]MBM9510579.1 hypothetical protein [Actinacidiphila acididurans]
MAWSWIAVAVAVAAATALSVKDMQERRERAQINARLAQLQADRVIPALDRALGPHRTLRRDGTCAREDSPYVEVHYTTANTDSVREEILRTVRAAGWHAEPWLYVGDDYFATDMDRQFDGWHSRQSFLNLHTGDLLVDLGTADHSGCLWLGETRAGRQPFTQTSCLSLATTWTRSFCWSMTWAMGL